MIIPKYILHHPDFILEDYLKLFGNSSASHHSKGWMHSTNFSKQGIITSSHQNFSPHREYRVHLQPKDRYGVDIIV